MSTYYSTLRSDSESRIKGYESRALTALATRRSAGNLPIDIGGSLASRHVSGLLGSGESDRAGRDIGTFQSWVYACVNSIATRVAGQPWMAGELKGAAKKPSRSFGGAKSLSHPWLKRAVPDRIIAKALADQELEMLASHPALDLMDQPNKLQRRWEFLYMSVANLALTGVCYWIGGLVKDGKNGDRMEIWAVPSSMLEPIHKDGLFSSYKWRSDMFGAGVMDDAPPIPAENVARTYMANPSDLTGVFSPLRACMRAVRTDAYIQDTQEQLFSHGMTPRLAVIVGDDPLGIGRQARLNDVQRRQVTRAIEELWSWTVNNGRPAILDALIKDVKRIDPTAQEFEWQASGEIVRQRIFATYRVNKFIVGDSENMNRAQVVEAQRQFADNVVNPICDSLSETACSWIAPLFDDKEQTAKTKRLWIWLKPVSVQDPDMESREWATARRNDDVSRNEFRAERLQLAPIDDEPESALLAQSPAAISGMVAIWTALSQGSADREQAMAAFQLAFGLDAEEAERLVGEAKERRPAPPQLPPTIQPGVQEQKPIAEPAPEQATGSSAEEGSAIENIAAEAKGLKYDPGQPRDEGGQWSDGGGGSGGSEAVPTAGDGGSEPQWERRRDREEATQAEADREVKKANKRLDKLTKEESILKEKIAVVTEILSLQDKLTMLKLDALAKVHVQMSADIQARGAASLKKIAEKYAKRKELSEQRYAAKKEQRRLELEAWRATHPKKAASESLDELLAKIDTELARIDTEFDKQLDELDQALSELRAIVGEMESLTAAIMSTNAEIMQTIAEWKSDEKSVKYDPAQPRIPAGSPAGGQWGEGGGASGGVGAGGGGNADDDDARWDMPDPTDQAAEATAAARVGVDGVGIIPATNRQEFLDYVTDSLGGKLKLPKDAVAAYNTDGNVEHLLNHDGRDGLIADRRVRERYAQEHGGLSIHADPSLSAAWEKSRSVKLSEKEKDAIGDYTMDFSVNDNLRAGKKLTKDMRNQVDAVNKMVDSVGEWKSPGTIYHGISASGDERQSFLAKARDVISGKGEWVEKGILSSSANRQMSEDWMQQGGKSGILMRIKTSRGAVVTDHSHLPGQEEILQKPGTRLRPTRIVEEKDSRGNNITIIDFEG